MDFLPAHLRVPLAVASYSVCSGTMLLFNKLAMHYGKSACGDFEFVNEIKWNAQIKAFVSLNS